MTSAPVAAPSVPALVQETKRPWMDGWTAALIVLMVAGFPLLVWAHAAGWLPAWAAVLLGTLLMNLSFTAWHEPAHANFSRVGWLNDLAGFLSSVASVYPGYYARRREHLVHHRYQGIEGMDPVYPRIQATFWGFPFQLLRSIVASPPLGVPASFLPITRGQWISDQVSNLLAVAALAASIALGFWPSLLWAWVLPRVIVFWLHAYYICFFPHSVVGGGYEVYRVRERDHWLPFVTVAQSLHGIHHRWPHVPWHRYAAVLRDARQEIEAAGVRLV
jgi:beta-carotene hydroxylase